MKSFTITDRGQFNAKEVILTVIKAPLGGPKGGGTTVDEMRADIRLLDLIEKAEGEVLIEDSDWSRLCNKLTAFPFAFSDGDLLAICESVLDAKAPQ